MADHLQVVIDVKNKLEAAGVSLAGNCGAFEVVKRVAWALRAEGFGLIAKAGGSNCSGYSIDLVQKKNGGPWVDILADAGGQNAPRWDEHDGADDSVWRAPIDPEDSTEPIPDPPPAPNPPTDLSEVLQRLQRIELKLDDTQIHAKAADDDLDGVLSALQMIANQLQHLSDMVADIHTKQNPPYQGRILGIGTTLTPKP